MQQATGTGKYERLLTRCESLAPVPTAVAHPCEATALAGALEAAARGLIVPLLVGPAARIAETAEAAGITIGDAQIVDVPSRHSVALIPFPALQESLIWASLRWLRRFTHS